jgi:hypothetical protein
MDANEEEIITKTSPSSSAFTPSFAGFIPMIHSGHLRFASIVVKKLITTTFFISVHSRSFAVKNPPLPIFLEI